TPRANRVVKFAIDEARGLEHQYVGTEHLLLGLLRESEGVAAQVLMNLGLSLSQVRQEVQSVLGYTQGPGGPPVPASPVDLNPDLLRLPGAARKIVAEFDCLIGSIQREKEAAVASHQ